MDDSVLRELKAGIARFAAMNTDPKQLTDYLDELRKAAPPINVVILPPDVTREQYIRDFYRKEELREAIPYDGGGMYIPMPRVLPEIIETRPHTT